jgi:hypothetical protein
MSKIKEISVGKEMKIGLPNYSNITARCDVKFEIAEGENVDWADLWDTINQQLSIQAEGIQASWIETKEYGNFFKSIVRTPKKEGGELNE